MTLPELRTTPAIAFDVVVPINPESYEITEDAAGRAYALVFDDARDAIGDAVRSELREHVADPGVEVRPGYVRVRTGVVDPATTPSDVRDAIRRAAGTYNDRHATTPDLDGLAFDPREAFLATYDPDAADPESFLDRHAPESAPDADGAVFDYSREDAGLSAGAVDDDRRFGYQIRLPLSDEMYDTGSTGAFDQPSRAITWDHDAVQDALRIAIEDYPAWPDHPENTPRIRIYPTHVAVDYYGAAPGRSPLRVARAVRRGMLRYNRYLPTREDRDRDDPNTHHEPIRLDHTAHVAPLDHGRTADDYLAERELDTPPTAGPADETAVAEDATDDDRGGSVFSSLSSLSSRATDR